MRAIRASALLISLLIAAGCGGPLVRDVPVSLRYTPVLGKLPPAAARTVVIGVFRDARQGKPEGIVGERVHFTRETDRFKPKDGVAGTTAAVVEGYFAKRGTRIDRSRWDGAPADLWNQRGDLAISGRVIQMWFAATDYATRGEASSIIRLEIVAGSPKSGTIITKTIQIEPSKKSNLFFETRQIEEWLSESLSEAIERVLPELERRLVG
ncbi:MAG: hypothetical protein HYT99_04920 [Candidatus Tectomicrobia bacterium]|nr:hypothetical protein [Candidatus Tectomicrobia bacterium]